MILLMEEILHQLIGSFSHSLQGSIHPRWLFGISCINSIFCFDLLVQYLVPWTKIFAQKPRYSAMPPSTGNEDQVTWSFRQGTFNANSSKNKVVGVTLNLRKRWWFQLVLESKPLSADPLAVRGERAQKFAVVRSSVFQRVLYLLLFGFFGSGLEDIECLVARVIGERFEWMKSCGRDGCRSHPGGHQCSLVTFWEFFRLVFCMLPRPCAVIVVFRCLAVSFSNAFQRWRFESFSGYGFAWHRLFVCI